MADIAVGDVVRLTQDHVSVERGVRYIVTGFLQRKEPAAKLHRIEHMPSDTWPRGAWSTYRALPVAWLEVDVAKTKAWKEATE